MTSDRNPQENFLARWSQRKAEVGRSEQASAPGPGPVSPADAQSDEEQVFDLASLPRIEDITGQTDIKPFLNKLVPEDVRNAALRRMWALDPAVLGYVDPALEYAYNWNAEGGVPGFGALSEGFDAGNMARALFSNSAEAHTLVEKPGSLPAPSAAAPSAAVASQAMQNLPATVQSRAAADAPAEGKKSIIGSSSAGYGASGEPRPRAKAQLDLPANEAATIGPRPRHGGASPR